MKSSLSVVSAISLVCTLGAGVAQARDADVQWSVTIGSPSYGGYGSYDRPAPAYRAPRPVIVYPQPIYYPYRAPTYWDRDGDGIPNRHDRFYNPAWDRDGDGIPNRYDRRYNPYGDRDHDGVPNRRDRHDDNPWRR